VNFENEKGVPDCSETPFVNFGSETSRSRESLAGRSVRCARIPPRRIG
jgi:hypothetical protein